MAATREPHRNVATVLVDPRALGDLELHLMAFDLWVWPVATAPGVADGDRQAFQVRRRLVTAARGRWDAAAQWVPVWVGFGETWDDGVEPLPWAAHEVLWRALRAHAPSVRFRLGLGGVARSMLTPRGPA